MEPIAFVKDCKGPEKEKENPVQMCLPEFVSEDPQFFKCDMPPLSEKFPEDSKIYFLGEHVYMVAAVLSVTIKTSLSMILAVHFSVILCHSALLNVS